MRVIIVLALLLVSACAPAAGAPATPSPAATASVTVTASPAPTARSTPSATAAPSRTPIVLPTTAAIAAAGNGVVWALVADSRLFRSTDRGDTWTERSTPSGFPLGAMTFAIAFVSDREGWILGAGSPAT